jgi:rod shape-determining protein MreB
MGRLASTLVVDIGAGTTDLCALYGTFPREEDQLTIPIGGDAIDEKFLELMAVQHPDAQLSLNMARELKETHGFVHDLDEAVRVTLPSEAAPCGQEFDVTEPLKEACLSIVPPIVAGIKELISSFDPEFRRPLLEQVLLGGGGSQLNGLGRQIELGLRSLGGGKVSRVYDSVFAGASGALKLAMTISDEEWRSMQQLEHAAA